jgi:hypothetical protein
MGTTEPWNIARIADAIPTPTMRMRFLSEVNLAPVGDLPAVVAKWQKVAEDLSDAYQRGLEVHSYVEEHGEFPPEFVRVTAAELREMTEPGEKGAA